MADKRANLYLAGYSGIDHAAIANFTGRTFTTAEKAVIATLVASIETYIARQCRRNFLDLGDTDSYYETLDAGKEEYYFQNFPVKEIRKITVDGTTKYELGGGSNSYTLNRDFFAYEDRVYFESIPASSTDNRNALKVYYAIEDVVGEDLKLAILQWVSDLVLNRETAGKGLKSMGTSGINLTFDENAIPSYVKSVIGNYKKELI